MQLFGVQSKNAGAFFSSLMLLNGVQSKKAGAFFSSLMLLNGASVFPKNP